ncbi:DUF6444 domain-containing protein [Streptomyces sp. NPDC048386]|uniref:DUF6444 domain-containing protein n=1 Tax=Streptomyces sp. NPDC048386 TaxID=3365541 RepID=UPI00372313FA
MQLLTANSRNSSRGPTGDAHHQRCKVNERLRAHMQRTALTLHSGNRKWDHFLVP